MGESIDQKVSNYKMDFKMVSIDTEIDVAKFMALPSENRKLAFDIYPEELMGDIYDKGIGLIKLKDRTIEQTRQYKSAEYIKKGIELTKDRIEKFRKNGFTMVPVDLTKEEINEIKSGKIPPIAKQLFTNLIGKTYKSINNIFLNIKKEEEKNISAIIYSHRKNIQKNFMESEESLKIAKELLVESVLNNPERLQIDTISKELIGDYTSKKEYEMHSLDVAVLSILIANELFKQRYGNKSEYKEILEDLAVASMFHDVGILLYLKQIKNPVDVENETNKYLKQQPDIIRKISEELTPTNLEKILIDYGQIILDKSKEKDISPYERDRIYKNHALYGALLLTDSNGKPLPGLNKNIIRIIFEYEYNNDGTLPRSRNPVMFDEELEKEIDILYKELGFDNIPITKNTRFVGSNKLETFGYETNEKKNEIVKKELDIISQILHIAERYYQLLTEFKSENLPDPFRKAVFQMYEEVKEGKINGYGFQILFNKFIPKRYYPNNLIFEIGKGGSGFLRKYVGHLATLGMYDNKQYIFVFKKDVKKENLKGKDLGSYVKSHELFENVKEDLNFIIDDWNHYHQNGLGKKIK